MKKTLAGNFNFFVVRVPDAACYQASLMVQETPEVDRLLRRIDRQPQRHEMKETGHSEKTAHSALFDPVRCSAGT